VSNLAKARPRNNNNNRNNENRITTGITIKIGLTIIGSHCCATMTPCHVGCLPPRKKCYRERQTDRHVGAHKVFFAHARA
jgi:hypothetical protein